METAGAGEAGGHELFLCGESLDKLPNGAQIVLHDSGGFSSTLPLPLPLTSPFLSPLLSSLHFLCPSPPLLPPLPVPPPLLSSPLPMPPPLISSLPLLLFFPPPTLPFLLFPSPPFLFSPFNSFPCSCLNVEKHKVFLPQHPLSCPAFLEGVVMTITLLPTPQDTQVVRRNAVGSVAQGVCGLDSSYLPPQSRTARGGEPGLEAGHPGRGSPVRDGREDRVRGP